MKRQKSETQEKWTCRKPHVLLSESRGDDVDVCRVRPWTQYSALLRFHLVSCVEYHRVPQAKAEVVRTDISIVSSGTHFALQRWLNQTVLRQENGRLHGSTYDSVKTLSLHGWAEEQKFP